MTAELITIGASVAGTACGVLLITQLPALYAKHVDNAKDKRKHKRDIAWQERGGAE